jgi:hypothetical protein
MPLYRFPWFLSALIIDGKATVRGDYYDIIFPLDLHFWAFSVSLPPA